MMCEVCGKDKKTYARGMCERCYRRDMFKRNPIARKRAQERKKEWYERNKEEEGFADKNKVAYKKYMKTKKYRKAMDRANSKRRYKAFIESGGETAKHGLVYIEDGIRVITPIICNCPIKASQELELFKQVKTKYDEKN